MDYSKEVAKRTYNNGITFQLAPEAGGVSQVHMACSKSLVTWSLSRGVLILLVSLFVLFKKLELFYSEQE